MHFCNLDCGSSAGMLQQNHPLQDCTRCIMHTQDTMHPCIPKPIHPDAGVRYTLPVDNCHAGTPERSFSTLKQLQTYLLSSMGDERLASLALIHVHAQTTPIELMIYQWNTRFHDAILINRWINLISGVPRILEWKGSRSYRLRGGGTWGGVSPPY